MRNLRGKIEIFEGSISWSLESEYDIEEYEYIVIHNLFVKEHFRRSGFARILMEVAITLIKKQFPNMEIKICVYSSESTLKENFIKFYKEFPVTVIT